MVHTTFYLLILTLLISPSLQSPINIWPKPRVFSWPVPQSIFLSPNLTVTSPYDHKYLSAATWRYVWLLQNERHRPLVSPGVSNAPEAALVALVINVADLDAPLHHGVNESYTLSIPATGGAAVITAATAWGAMRGLESLSQLVWGNPPQVAAGVFISDWPIFAHRGVLLDTSRNYFGMDDILRTIGAMSANKLNVFHWHITDSQSFPVELESEPGLAERGSYGSGMRFSAADVKRVVEFGLEHGVRVMPEIDMPGHTGSWAEAYPEIVTCANMFWWPAGAKWSDRLASEPGTGQLNPLSPKTYKVVKNVINDITSMFPEPFYHGGADEIAPNCWKADPLVQKHLENNGTLSDLLELFMNTTFPYIVSNNRTAVFWEDILLSAEISVSPLTLPPKYTILQTWNDGPNNTKKLVQAGYRTIVSSADFYYLDCGHGGFVGNDSKYDQPPGTDQGKGGSWCAPFKTWQLIYNYDITYGLSEDEAELVLGGEVALWTEQSDPTVLDARIWPRASALAEAMWSGNKDETGMERYAEATDRLIEWRYRMVTRGVAAEPIQPLWCIRNPDISPCLSYLKSAGGAPPAACCAGAKTLASAASGTANTRVACNCLKSASKSIKLNLSTTKALPGKCGINLGFSIDPNIDCSSIG